MLRQFFKRRIFFRIGRAGVSVKAAHDFRRTGMKLGALSETIETRVGQFLRIPRERSLVHAQVVREEAVQRFLAGKVGGVFEEFGAQLLGEPDHFKQMAVAIAGQRGNAHAGKNFAQAGVHRDAHLFRTAGLERFGELVRKIRYDGSGSGGDEQGDMMRVKYLSGFDDQRHIPKAFLDHRFPDGSGRKQSRQRSATLVNPSIAEEEESRAPAAAQRGSGKPSKTAARPRNSSYGGKRKIDFFYGAKDRAQLRQLRFRDDWAGQRDALFQWDIERHHVGFA